ncbi:hypothetical protein TPA0909_64080 [Streptomyces albus]|nr:hypothetical protein TPA0909_64080 [Streptomyces albus]
MNAEKERTAGGCRVAVPLSLARTVRAAGKGRDSGTAQRAKKRDRPGWPGLLAPVAGGPR